MMERLRLFNPFFRIFGWEIIESRMGHWSVGPNNELFRRTFHCGWRWAKFLHGVPDGATELDRLVIGHKDEINQRRAAKAEGRS